MKTLTYKDAGVDIDAGDELVQRIRPHVARTARPEVLSPVGGFASLVTIPQGYAEPVLVSGTDGVGTKLKIAFARNDHRTVGIDLVAMCVNDVLATGAEPLFFLDYYACSELSPEAAEQVVAGIAEGCAQAGAALVGGETAELPGFYAPGEYDLAGFCVGVVERSRIVDGKNVQPGDAVVGLYASGLHSNGYSLARKVVETAGVSLDAPLHEGGPSIGEALLTPTRIYVKPVRACMEAVEVRAIAHITGGGLLENIPRTLPNGLGVSLEATWPVPPIFDWLAATGPVERRECLRTFNMGIGMTLVVPPEHADAAVTALRESGQEAQIIGTVVPIEQGAPRVRVSPWM